MKNSIFSRKLLTMSSIRFPLFWQMLLSMTLVLCLSIGVLWGYLQVNFNDLMQRQIDTFANTVTQQAANSAAEMLMAEDYLALSSMLENIVHTSDNILSISIEDDLGKTVAIALRTPETEETDKEKNSQAKLSNDRVLDKNSRRYRSDIIFHQVTAGSIQLSIDNSAISNSLIKALSALGLILIGIISLATLSSIVIAKKLTQSLKQLQQTTKQVAKGNLSPALPRAKNNEVGDLVTSFEHMLQGLRDKEAIEKNFHSFISKDIAKDILSDLDQPKKPLKHVCGSVLFVDIIGFTELSEKQTPIQIAEALNQYYSLIHQVSKIYWGSVDNFIGDGAMITFGVHNNDAKHSINAICAAKIFIRLTKALNKHRISHDLPELNFRLGLHCGDMLAGAIGDQERMQFTITGDAVNVASRLCDIASPNKLMISECIYQHPACHDLLVTEASESFRVKGKKQPIKCFNVIGLAPQFNRILMQQENELIAMQKYV